MLRSLLFKGTEGFNYMSIYLLKKNVWIVWRQWFCLWWYCGIQFYMHTKSYPMLYVSSSQLYTINRHRKTCTNNIMIYNFTAQIKHAISAILSYIKNYLVSASHLLVGLAHCTILIPVKVFSRLRTILVNSYVSRNFKNNSPNILILIYPQGINLHTDF